MDDLIDSYKNNNVILFVGAGISKNLGLPVWSELIGKIGEELGYDHKIFETYGDSLALAEFYKLKKGSIGPLRSWMDTNWHSGNIDIGSSKIHTLISNLNFPIIYTTNYDRWIEKALDYNKKEGLP